MTYRLVLYMTLSFCMAYFAYWWWPAVSKPIQTVKEARSEVPDAWMETVDATFMGKDGQILMKIHTPTITHFAKNDTTLFTTPEFLLYHQSANPWHVQAGIATATQGMRQIRLSESVTLRHPGDTEHPETWVDTDK